MPKLNIDLSKIVKYLNENAGQKNLDEMQVELKLSKSFIRKIANSQGIRFQEMQVKKKVSNIEKLLKGGMTPREIARELGCYDNSVHYLIRTYIGEDAIPQRVKTVVNTSPFFNPSERENWLV